MAAGIAVAFFAVMLSLAIPRSLSASAARIASRTPSAVDQATTTTLTTSAQRVGDETWTRVDVFGVTDKTPVAPGLVSWPPMGVTVVSPALASRLKTEGELSKQIGNVVSDSRIGPAGLASPDELLSYTRHPTQQNQGEPLVRFGGTPTAVDVSVGLELVPFEVAALVGIPAVLFLSICARLSVTSRQQRLRSLRLLGVPVQGCARIYATELGFVALAGAFTAVIAYLAAEPLLARSGVLGLRWFPGDTTYPVVALFAVVLLAGLATTTVSRIAIRRSLQRPRASVVDRTPRRWQLALGAALLLPSLSFLVFATFKVMTGYGPAPVLSSDSGPLMWLIGTTAAATGLLLVLSSITRWVTARASAASAPSVAVRLGCRFASVHVAVGSRMVAAIVALLLVATTTGALLRGFYLDGVGDRTRIHITLDVSEVPASNRSQLTDLGADATVVSLPATAAGASDSRVYDIDVATCRDYVYSVGLESDPKVSCSDEPLRADTQTPTVGPVPGLRLSFDDGAESRTVTVPERAIGVAGGADMLLPPSSAPRAALAPGASVTYVVSAATGGDQRLLARLAGLAPNARPQAEVKDPSALARYQQQRAVLRTLLAIAYTLCLAGFVVSLLDARWSTLRTIASQWAIGVPPRVIRGSAAVQFAAPVLIGAALVVPVAAMSSTVLLSMWSADAARSASAVGTAVGLAALATTTTALLGWSTAMIGVRRSRLEFTP
jgi:hypothetical protein